MTIVDDPAQKTFILTDLAPELLLEITLWAQHLWHTEIFAAQAPYNGLQRHVASRPLQIHVLRSYLPHCCNGTDEAHRGPQCLTSTKTIPLSLRSPAHCLSQVARSLRALLMDGNVEIWNLDNTLFPHIAERSGIVRGMQDNAPVIQYGSRNLIAVNVCSCLIPAIASFYSSLENVKLALPWPGHEAHPWSADVHVGTQSFWYTNAGPVGSPLRYIDLEIYSPDPAAAKFTREVLVVESHGLLVSRFANCEVIYYSHCLTSLHVYFSEAWEIQFAESLLTALRACMGTLQYLTIDVAHAYFELDGVNHIVLLPALRYLRLHAPQYSGGTLLRYLALPMELDIHLEPLVDWTKRASFIEVTEPPFEVPFLAFDAEDQEDCASLARYVASLAAPLLTRCFFTSHYDPSIFVVQPIWRSFTAMGLRIQLDPSMTAKQHVASRFPQSITVALAANDEALNTLLEDPAGYAWKDSPALQGKRTARRSLTVRDGDCVEFYSQRTADQTRTMPIPLYDSIRWVIGQIQQEKRDTVGVQELSFARESWLPDRSLGYQYILGDLQAVKSIRFTGHFLSPAIPFLQNMQGCVSQEHITALALYLNTPQEGYNFPCLCLEIIWLPTGVWSPNPEEFNEEELRELYNSPERRRSGAPQIRIDYQ
ncbi:unnamed protein product [Peniophora sp. CBMAI 1063]|nr:unnamed protein product [Peniophora sp. CBMAI 1063]